MGLPVYVEIETAEGKKIAGECTEAEHKDWIFGFGFSSGVSIPTDPNSGKVTGSRVHMPFEFAKPVDKSSPILFQAMCKGGLLKKVVVDLMQKDQSGNEVNFYRYTFSEAQIVAMTAESPDIRDVGQQFVACHEKVRIRYRKVQVEHRLANTMAVDEFMT
ncbi:type VI secretion system tube protein TssD [Cupriavidus sp. D39]|uniref:type VI secretion system tube protein TssD n=1 Tax=Cupriavidus sp. D39 TaxID=2997877 RepID=UPI0022713FC0|nr:type VI secretion system tube protein TssD [Cupriavidus sp. D39]MCY0858671.1 type VI secretion system tube protein TssD [Cupriavidus sp. D39]